jgi:hypothetical protein
MLNHHVYDHIFFRTHEPRTCHAHSPNVNHLPSNNYELVDKRKNAQERRRSQFETNACEYIMPRTADQ